MINRARQAYASTHVLVVGDVMLDRYWHGATRRISPEAPVPVVQVERAEERAGGAANVAMNVRALGCRATLAGVVGQDADGERLASLLGAAGVEDALVRCPSCTTVVKLRVTSQHQQLIRLDFERSLQSGARPLLEAVEALLVEARVMVLSDYAKGTVEDPRAIIERARRVGVPVVVDPKHADFARYAGASVVTPNLKEFEAATGRRVERDSLGPAARELCRRHGLEAVLVTRGEEGMTLVPREGEPLSLPARARDVFDVTGAGDTVCAVLAASLGAGYTLEQATAFANAAAGLVVGKLGTATVGLEEIEASLSTEGAVGHGVLGEEELLRAVAEARRRGETIVMTNGCFDILHAGHVTYLARARALGDRLVVAVNDDRSVRGLKGEGRPVNPLARRMLVLSALQSVDWVVPFVEDTPERLIGRVLPDVLVKGGDYRPEQIAGARAVRQAGGEVVVLDYIEGCSTSAILEGLAASEPRP